MWRYIKGDTAHMGWHALGLHLGSAVMVTDGSYNKSLAPHISGTGWIIACRQHWKMLGGWFYECSKKAGSYRGKLLGSVAVYLLSAFAAEYSLYILQ
jgi:hypothetical protein